MSSFAPIQISIKIRQCSDVMLNTYPLRNWSSSELVCAFWSSSQQTPIKASYGIVSISTIWIQLTKIVSIWDNVYHTWHLPKSGYFQRIYAHLDEQEIHIPSPGSQSWQASANRLEYLSSTYLPINTPSQLSIVKVEHVFRTTYPNAFLPSGWTWSHCYSQSSRWTWGQPSRRSPLPGEMVTLCSSYWMGQQCRVVKNIGVTDTRDVGHSNRDVRHGI